jgi:hypothetical protein
MITLQAQSDVNYDLNSMGVEELEKFKEERKAYLKALLDKVFQNRRRMKVNGI